MDIFTTFKILAVCDFLQKVKKWDKVEKDVEHVICLGHAVILVNLRQSGYKVSKFPYCPWFP